MAIFIMLSRLSPEGMQTLRNNPERIQEVNREIEGFGARVVQQYALLGPYDFITVLEAPDPETVARVSVELSSRATASYETLTAVPVEEFISRIRGERGQDASGAQQPTYEPASSAGRSEDTTTPRTSSIEEVVPPPRTEEPAPQARESVGQSESRREEEAPPRAEEAAPESQPRTGGDAPPVREEEVREEKAAPAAGSEAGPGGARQPEGEREEDRRPLLQRVKDELLGQESPSREEPGRRDPNR